MSSLAVVEVGGSDLLMSRVRGGENKDEEEEERGRKKKTAKRPLSLICFRVSII